MEGYIIAAKVAILIGVWSFTAHLKGSSITQDIQRAWEWISYKSRVLFTEGQASGYGTEMIAVDPSGFVYAQIVASSEGGKNPGVRVSGDPDVQAVVLCHPGDAVIHAARLPVRVKDGEILATVVSLNIISKITHQFLDSKRRLLLVITDDGNILRNEIPEKFKDACTASLEKFKGRIREPVWVDLAAAGTERHHLAVS